MPRWRSRAAAHGHLGRPRGLPGRGALVLSRHRQRRGPALRAAPRRPAGLPARRRRAHAGLRRLQGQPAIHHHRQPRRQPARLHLRDGLRAAAPHQAVGTRAVVADDPALLARLWPEGYDARPEQIILFEVEAWDTDCPQHIPQLFHAEDVGHTIQQFQAASASWKRRSPPSRLPPRRAIDLIRQARVNGPVLSPEPVEGRIVLGMPCFDKLSTGVGAGVCRLPPLPRPVISRHVPLQPHRHPHWRRHFRRVRHLHLPRQGRHLGQGRFPRRGDARRLRAQSAAGARLLQHAPQGERQGRAQRRALRACQARDGAPDQDGGEVLVVTQNVDALHEAAGTRNLIHMHGQHRQALCNHCRARHPWGPIADLALDLACAACGKAGGLRPDVVWFGEMPYHMDAISPRSPRPTCSSPSAPAATSIRPLASSPRRAATAPTPSS